jgi:hypothetical protein
MINNAPTPQPEIIAKGVTLERLLNNRVFMFTSQNTSNEGIDLWIAKMRLLIEEVQPAPVHLIMVSLNPKISFTTVARKKVAELIDEFSEQHSYNAMIIQNYATLQLFRLFGVALNRQKHRLVFYRSIEEAIAWHQKHLAN